MKAEMTFNAVALEAQGYAIEDVYDTIKRAFVKRGLRCTSESEVLSFEGVGSEHDFANMMGLLVGLVQVDWFMDCASSCIFYDDDGVVEDILCSAPNIRKALS
ncbi:MAG: hypothetical protein E7429_02775 [Ruminococcaceae bacterium]|nr:hypothetical protein [Oscillospiraceae bacterium]